MVLGDAVVFEEIEWDEPAARVSVGENMHTTAVNSESKKPCAGDTDGSEDAVLSGCCSEVAEVPDDVSSISSAVSAVSTSLSRLLGEMPPHAIHQVVEEKVTTLQM